MPVALVAQLVSVAQWTWQMEVLEVRKWVVQPAQRELQRRAAAQAALPA